MSEGENQPLIGPDLSSTLVLCNFVSTVADSAPRLIKAFQKACAREGWTAPGDKALRDMIGEKSLYEIIDRFFPELDEEAFSRFFDSCNEECDLMLDKEGEQEALFPSVRHALGRLKARGAVIGAFSGIRHGALQQLVKHHCLENIFRPELVRGKDNVLDRRMPKAELKRHHLRFLSETNQSFSGHPPEYTIIIGDSLADLRASQELGFRFVAFAASEDRARAMREAGCRHFISHYDGLEPLISSIVQPAQARNALPASALSI